MGLTRSGSFTLLRAIVRSIALIDKEKKESSTIMFIAGPNFAEYELVITKKREGGKLKGFSTETFWVGR